MEGYEKIEKLLNALTEKARSLKVKGFSNKTIRNILTQYNADSWTIELIMLAI